MGKKKHRHCKLCKTDSGLDSEGEVFSTDVCWCRCHSKGKEKPHAK